MKNPRLLVFAFLAILLSTLTGCSTAGYYWQAASGHIGVLRRQVPIENVIASPETSPALREKLIQVQELRQFAQKTLHLPAGNHYTRYADLQRRFVVWNVHAAPEFSMEAHTWWYPLIGRLKYRGYFNENEAKELGAAMAADGMDVYVAGVEAYSTLGLLRDPVLSTFVHHNASDLAEILFHELAHQKVFISGDTDFNEAFAVAVAQEGTRRWLQSKGGMEVLGEYERDLQRESQFHDMIRKACNELESLYSTHGSDTPEQKRALKNSILEELRAAHQRLKTEWGGTSPFDPWFAKPINNARLNTVATYYDLVPGFLGLLKAEGNNLDRFFAMVQAMGKLPPKERRKTLYALASSNSMTKTEGANR